MQQFIYLGSENVYRCCDLYRKLCDEFNSASHATQSAAYKLVLDRMVGEYKLHPKVVMIAAGNLEDDNAIVNPMSSALISRFAHFYIRLDKKEWLDWATKNKVDTRITAFIGFKDKLLYTFNPDLNTPYAAPRTWEMLSKVISKIDNLGTNHLALVASLVGEGVANEFISFIKYYQNIPTYSEITNNPESARMDSNIGTQWAVMGMVVSNITDDTLQAACTYLQRMSMELQTCALRELKNRNPALMATKELRQWRLALGAEAFV